MSYANGHKRVLIVDDEKSIAELIALFLKTKGYFVEIALTGTQALSQLKQGFDIIILDIVLPDYHGFKICEYIKNNPITQGIPIIVISGHYNHDNTQRHHLEVDDFLEKPFNPEDLFLKVESVLRRKATFTLEPSSQRQLEVIVELRRIIDQELIVPHFQPIYQLKPFKILGFEALSRPQSHSQLSNPEVIFREALKYGLYFDLEMIGWKKAIQAFKNEASLKREALFLNCNPYLVESEKYFGVKDLFDFHEMPLDQVFLEITERTAINEESVFFERLRKYRDHGFKIAVDDVGGGYSSLESIVQTHPEVVKIDRHIVCALGSDPFKRSIVKLIVSFCRENGIISIAEGIESKEDLEVLLELGIDAGQGYYLCRPKETIAECLR